MPISLLKRKTRRLSRRVRNWTTIATLTLKGNKVPRNTKPGHWKNPILMIYGFGASRRTMAILEHRLKQDGYTTFSLNLGGLIGTFNTVSIEESARFIDKRIEQLYKKNKLKGKISVVGHSKGGLIGSYYIKFMNGSRRVQKFITLGTPYNGTPWALLSHVPPVGFICKSLTQMKSGSEFLHKLNNTPYAKSVKAYSIYSKDDNACPIPASVVEEAHNVNNIEVFGVTHSELLIKKTVFNAIRHALRDEMPESWIEASRKSYKEYLKKNPKSQAPNSK